MTTHRQEVGICPKASLLSFGLLRTASSSYIMPEKLY